MAEITIKFRHNKTTGKRELVIHLESDSDVLSHEHEADHRRLVESLIGMPVDDDTDVVIERISASAVGKGETSTTTPAAEQQAAKVPEAKKS
ncbi:MAG: hypothetical protein Q8O67_29585 [Deltaproteobacteria bacterium]|nr:hypothetical protein [Deltaproteobacteria bacterium]